MSGFALTVETDDLQQLSDLVDQLAGAAGSRELLEREGQVLQEVVHGHFEELAADSIHHETAQNLGAAPTGFYEKAAESVHSFEIEGGDGVSVSVDYEGVAQRYFGGDIEGDQWLTIPARAETYGHRARELDDLQAIIFPGGESGMLIAKPQGARIRGKRGGRGRKVAPIDELGSDVFYWLVHQVHQEPDPTVLPEDDEILDPAVEAANEYLDVVRGR